MTRPRKICLIGFGEVGQLLSRQLHDAGAENIVAWDVKFASADSAPNRALLGSPARGAASLADAIQDASLVISAVTAADCLDVAKAVAALSTAGPHFFDLNSVAPETKADAARVLESRGVPYVEAAVMSPIAPKGISSPILIGGPRAEPFLPQAHQLGFSGVEYYSPVIGKASAAKMCRSVMIKGVEALLAESLLAARRYGVEQTVLSSLQTLLPAADWGVLSRYMISRAIEHGVRRADEMREAALTVAGAGLDPWMSNACANRQDWCASMTDALRQPTLEGLLDATLAHIPDPRGEG